MTRHSDIASRIRMRLNRQEGIKSLDQIVLSHGYVEGQPWSFKNHEFQIEIIRDIHQRIAVRKCSQVGLSELMVQKTLALLASIPNLRMMFSLPTKEMALTFSKDRIDGAINASDHYSGMTVAASNSAGYKELGSSKLYVVGTHGAKAGISVPVEFLISDEVDFSNEVVLGKMNSRLRHAKIKDEFGNRGYRARFSTPTVDGFGIDLDFQKGDQRHYLVKCKCCEKWVLPSYLSDFVVPGYDGPMAEFGKPELRDERYDISKAWIKCPSCSKNLWPSLLDPDRRQWVAKKPDVVKYRSYQVSPWDVPSYNEPHVILESFDDYPLLSDFMNFVIGLPHSDAENSFFTDTVHRERYCVLAHYSTAQELWTATLVMAHTYGGMDVGKTCHLTVRIRVGKGSHVVHMQKIHNTRANPATQQVLDAYDEFNMRRLLIDNGPDITLVKSLVGARDGISAVVYVRDNPSVATEKANGEQINVDRTRSLSMLLADHNSGYLCYPRQENLAMDLYAHFKTTKKIREKNADGEMVARFVKSDDADHWVHSLNYSGMAVFLEEFSAAESHGAAALPSVAGVKLGSAVKDKPKDKLEGSLRGLFGFRQPNVGRRR